MEVILSILVALFGIGFGIFMALQPENVIALRSRRWYTQVPEPTEEYIRLTRLEGGYAYRVPIGETVELALGASAFVKVTFVMFSPVSRMSRSTISAS